MKRLLILSSGKMITYFFIAPYPLVDQNWQNQRSLSIFIPAEIQIACQKEIPDR